MQQPNSTSTPNRGLLIEVCVDSVESAIAAQHGGADRVELCDNLPEGGTTPSAGMIALARGHLSIGLHVLIRPRGGDFCYSDIELAVMQHDITLARQLGADGVVFGILLPEGTVDAQRTRTLIELARPMSVTFHRAFDMTVDPHRALDQLIALGVERVLTSGQEVSALEGLDLIGDLVRYAGDRISIMPGGGAGRNIRKIVDRSGAREVHLSASMAVDSPMAYRNPRVFMGHALRSPEYTRMVADPARIGELRRQAQGTDTAQDT